MGSGHSTQNFSYEGQLLSDKKIYSREIQNDPDHEKDPKTFGAPHRRMDALDDLVSFPFGVDTIWDQFQLGVEKFKDNDMIGTRAYNFEDEQLSKHSRGEYTWLSYKQVDERVRKVGKGMAEIGLSKGDTIGIFSINRAEWTMTALANYSQTLKTVALYDTLGDEAIEYISNHAELKAIFVDLASLKHLLKILDKIPTVQFLVLFDANEDFGNKHEIITEKDKSIVEASGKQLLGFVELQSKGAQSEKDIQPPKKDDLAIIMYTSGTTGQPKGVMLSHGNVTATAVGFPSMSFEPGDKYISYLPLAHIFETCAQTYCFAVGVAIGFFQGHIKMIMDDLNTLQPALMCGVPRVYERIYERTFSKVNNKGGLAKFIFDRCYKDQSKNVRKGNRSSTDDLLVFNKVRGSLGLSKLKAVVTGGAPCPPYLLEFLKVMFGCPVVQGYGLTETAAALSASIPDDNTTGHVGPPMGWAEIRLKSVPEMEYLVTDEYPRGEVQCRGEGVFKGYFKNEEASKKDFDGDWFCTGDIGRWNPNGTLSIIDRKKNIFKLSQGEYIAAEKIENVYKKSSLVGQIWIYGNSYKPCVVAVVVPSAENVCSLAASKGIFTMEHAFGTREFPEEFKKKWEQHSKALIPLIEEDMKTFEEELKGFEKVKSRFYVADIDDTGNGFSIENDCMTPTFKLRRPFLLKRYIEEIKKMYTDLGMAPKDDEVWIKN